MTLLTRSEEFVLLAVWRLQGDAYSLALMKQLSKSTGESWSLGSIFTPLERLTKRGLVTSFRTKPTAERGGRPKRIYQLTPLGKRELLHTREVENTMWSGITNLALAGVRT
ncbi:MAG: PadR family transcriptional regulator PadR [Rhodothermales bacterium]|jgi:PadR family transcriptional regulator PadR